MKKPLIFFAFLVLAVALAIAQRPAATLGAPGGLGASGPSGPSGSTGATGPSGPSGPNGASGPSGPSGASGPSGPSGVVGTTTVTCAGTGTLTSQATFLPAIVACDNYVSQNAGTGAVTLYAPVTGLYTYNDYFEIVATQAVVTVTATLSYADDNGPQSVTAGPMVATATAFGCLGNTGLSAAGFPCYAVAFYAVAGTNITLTITPSATGGTLRWSHHGTLARPQ